MEDKLFEEDQPKDDTWNCTSISYRWFVIIINETIEHAIISKIGETFFSLLRFFIDETLDHMFSLPEEREKIWRFLFFSFCYY